MTTQTKELPHTMEDDFEHFLSYSGFHAETDEVKAKLLRAFDAAWEPASPADAQPVAWVRETELAKLADPRVAGVGMMMHKDSGANLVPVYRHPSPTTAPASEKITDNTRFMDALDGYMDAVTNQPRNTDRRIKCRLEVFAAVDAHTAAQVAASKAPVVEWISVQDRLPEDEGTVLVTCNGNVGIGGYSKPTGQPRIEWWYTGFAFNDDDIPTHWMPLPTPPAMTNASEGGEHV